MRESPETIRSFTLTLLNCAIYEDQLIPLKMESPASVAAIILPLNFTTFKTLFEGNPLETSYTFHDSGADKFVAPCF